MNNGHYIYIYSSVGWTFKIGTSAWSGLVKNLFLAFRLLFFFIVFTVLLYTGATTVESSMEVSLKTELPCDPGISLLGLYPKKTKTLIQKDICTPLFIAALFTIANTWKQSKCPLTNEYTKKVWYIHTMGFYSAIKKEWNFVICSNTDGFGRHYAKWNKSEKGK